MRRFLAGLITVTVAGLVYVYTEVEAMKIGYRIRKQEETKTAFIDRARALTYNIAKLRAPNNLVRRLAAQKIELQSPKAWQTVVMPGARPEAVSRASLLQGAPDMPALARFFIGTARAEAKDTRVR